MVAVGVQRVGYRRLVRPVMFRTRGGDPEGTHQLLMHALGGLSRRPRRLAAVRRLLATPRAPVTVAGLELAGPVGLAAGMDKRAEAVRVWSALGFSHVELGTVTARAQPGNARPRVFRLPASKALINRMGFNNDGAPATAARLAAQNVWRGNGAAGLAVGLSLGKSKVTPVEVATADYLASFAALAPHADYVAVNVSSPNTPGLRSLQGAAELRGLLGALVAQSRATGRRPVPILVKIAPDLSDAALDEALTVCADTGVAGLIATNTTLARDGLAAADAATAAETGGLSGRPLRARALEVVRYVAARTDLDVIGVGGIGSAEDALAMLDAGAKAVQLYTGFIYGGPPLVADINRRHAARAQRQEATR